MAKFELNIYSTATGEIEKVYTRNFMPVGLYIKYQKFSEKVIAEKVKDDTDFYENLKALMLETFPQLTKGEFDEGVDTAEALVLFRDILSKATQFESSKNA